MSNSYFHKFLDGAKLAKISADCAANLKRYEFDAIAFRGMSGAMIAPPVAALMGKTLILVRKPGESTHSSDTVEGDVRYIKRYVILDDFVATGNTAREIQRAIQQYNPKAVCLGVLEAHELFAAQQLAERDLNTSHNLT